MKTLAIAAASFTAGAAWMSKRRFDRRRGSKQIAYDPPAGPADRNPICHCGHFHHQAIVCPELDCTCFAYWPVLPEREAA